jgi:hypothetical protein
MRALIGLTVLIGAPVLAQTPGDLTEVFECRTPPERAAELLAALKPRDTEIHSDEDGRWTTKSYASGKVRPFDLPAKALTYTIETTYGDKFASFASIVGASFAKTQAQVLAARGLNACPNRSDGACEIPPDGLGLPTIVVAAHGANQTRIECFFEVQGGQGQ